MNSSFLILKNRNFLIYWLATWFSVLADAVFTLGMAWFIVQTTSSGAIMGTFLLVMGAMRSAFTLFGGVYVDRISPMVLMQVSLLARCLIMVGLIVVMATSSVNLWMLYALAVVFGLFDAFFLPAAATVRQRLVAPEYFTQLNSLLLVAGQVSTVIGPVIGSGLTALGGFPLIFGVIIVAYVVAIFLLRVVRLKPLTEEQLTAKKPVKKSFGKDLREGLSYVRNTPLLLTNIVIAALVNAGVCVMTVALPFLSQELHFGVQGLGVMNSGIGLGGALAAVIFSVWVIARPTPRMNLTACLFEGMSVMAICFVNNMWGIAILLCLTGVTTTAINVIAPSVNQTIIPKELFGRVISVMMLTMSGTIPISQALAGFLIDHVSAHQVFLYGGLLEAGAAFVGFFLPSVRRYGKTPENFVIDNNC